MRSTKSSHSNFTEQRLRTRICTSAILPLLLLLTLPITVRAQFTYTTNNGTITITGYIKRLTLGGNRNLNFYTCEIGKGLHWHTATERLQNHESYSIV